MERQIATKTKLESSTSFPLSRGILQRKCACGNQSAGGGECAECSKKNQLLQRRAIHISDPSDRYEQEADRIADEVMRMPEPTIQHQVESEKDDVVQREVLAHSITPLQRYSTDQDRLSEVPPIVNEVLGSPGQELESNARKFMESRFRHDFSNVRVHTDARAAESARAINALAYTVHNDIVFNADQYRTNTETGKRLLAHELTHVLQQQASPQKTSSLQRMGDDLLNGLSNDVSANTEYDVDDAVASLEFVLSFAESIIDDPSLPSFKRDKIENQILKLQPLITQLEEARDSDGEGIIFGFDPDPKENEINSGDSEKSIEELYADSPISPKGLAVDQSDAISLTGTLQAKTTLEGLQITPLTTPSVQRDGGVTVVVIIVLAGLLLEGCKKDSGKAAPTPAPSSSKPTGKACVKSETIPRIKLETVVFQGVDVLMQTEVEIEWEESPNCNPACGEYRQYVKGHLTIDGKPFKLTLCDGATLQENVYQEDGDVQGNKCCGHRDRPEFKNDIFDQPNRSVGRHYLGKDEPRVPASLGKIVDVNFQFKGQTYDKCTNTFGAIHEWAFTYKGPI